MKLDHDHHHLVAHLQRLAAASGCAIVQGKPLAKFRHVTGSIVLTRDGDSYRKLPEWTELPFDTSSPVPRSPR